MDTERKGRFFSSYYHKYFEGYSEYSEKDEYGVPHIKRVYTGQYYAFPFSRNRRIVMTVMYIFAGIVAAGLFVFSASRDLAENRQLWIVLLQALTIAGFGWMFRGVINYCIVPMKMTTGEFKCSSKRLKNGCIFTSVFLICLGSVIVVMKYDWSSALCAGGYIIGAMLMILIFIIEHKTDYIVTSSEEHVPYYAAHI